MIRYRRETPRGFRSCRMFTDMMEMFNLSAADWEKILNELEELSADSREEILYGLEEA